MIGFETIGNATVTVFDDEPILSTDPWIFGNPYFGSWGHKYKIPEEQLQNIKKSKYFFLSHGHPDHIDPDSFELFKNKTLIIGDHYGDRIYNDLKFKYDCIKLKSNSWFEISKNIRIKSFADWNQDTSLIIEILKKDIILNLNDSKARGWSTEIKKIIKNYQNKFLLQLVNEADADMINFYNHHNTFLPPQTSKNGIGKIYTNAMNNWFCNFAVPFSCFHKYIRKDSLKMNEFVSPLKSHYQNFNDKPGQYDQLKAPIEKINSVEFVDQNPIGRSSRSNPVTYIKAYDEIRTLFASQSLSKNRGYQAKHFSFNVDGGRCEHCKGDGNTTIEMQFMADVVLECEHCKGKRFKKEILEVKYGGLSLDALLEMSVDEAIDFFKKENHNKMVQKLKPLQAVGLGYVALGQPSTTLSGGEAQRIKLASFIGRGTTRDKIVFIFDEPTTGLHFHDINKLLLSFNALIDQGHTVIVVEHNLELIKCADHIIDLGPEGGKNGGQLVAMGTPEKVAAVSSSFTAAYLSKKLVF